MSDPIALNDAQESLVKSWAADDRLWTTQETVEFNLRTFTRSILKAHSPDNQQDKQSYKNPIGYYVRIVLAADALEDWLGKNAGHNDEWPINIKADKDGAIKLTALLTDLKAALEPYRRLRRQ